MFGGPVPGIAEGIDMAAEIDAVAERLGGRGARSDERQVENGKVGHAGRLMAPGRPTKPIVGIAEFCGKWDIRFVIFVSFISSHSFKISKHLLSRL